MAVYATAAARLKVEQLVYDQWSSNINIANTIKEAKEKDNFNLQLLLNDPDAGDGDGWF